MIENTISLIIDDKIEDGSLICDYLRREFLPYQFYHYDEEKHDVVIDEKDKLSGIRIIFQDLALISSTHPSKSDYDAAADTIESLLSERNGPWLLITWSTWSMPESKDDTYPKQLFDHLHEELPESLRPFAYIALDKSFFTTDNRHGPAKPLQELSEEQEKKLSGYIKDGLSNSKSLHFLTDWEKNAKAAIYSTASELSQLAMQQKAEPDNALGKIIYELAIAHAGKNVEKDDYLQHSLSEVLSDIIRDKIEYNKVSSSQKISFDRLSDLDKKTLEAVPFWKSKINKAIHIDTHSFENENSTPGSVFIIEKDGAGITFIPGEITDTSKLNKFKRKHFLNFMSDERNEKDKICGEAKIICVDMTPPCDHANKKAEWNKYMIGLLLPTTHEKYCCLLSKNKETGINERDERRLLGDNLVKIPNVYLTTPSGHNEFRMIFNSRLTISLPSDKSVEILGNGKIGRIREQLLSDMRSWFIRQTTRPGIVELR
ncbi:hypothetical protein [Serratia marcescens]|uniref:Response receiver domain-containing protein n=1 Tax=Serratia marcescens TaxID=615 RepID=A0ABD6HVI3_SERMA|nr:hypothetical protein [Serratia marcescens]MVF04936.1 hypothetical protein [Serratia marcescens]